MLCVTIKGLLARKVRLAATVVAVTLGVAFTAGTLVLTDTIGKTFDDLFAEVYDGTDAVVRAPSAFDAPAGASDQRGRVDQSLVDVVAGVDGVAVAEGTVVGYTQLVGADGKPLGDPEIGAPTLGGNWSRSDDLNPFTLVEGRAPTADDEVVIDRKSANDGHLAWATRPPCWSRVRRSRCEVVGIAKFGDADSPGGASFVLFTSRQRSGWSRSPASSTRSSSWPTGASRSRSSRTASPASCPSRSRSSPATRSARRARTPFATTWSSSRRSCSSSPSWPCSSGPS